MKNQPKSTAEHKHSQTGAAAGRAVGSFASMATPDRPPIRFAVLNMTLTGAATRGLLLSHNRMLGKKTFQHFCVLGCVRVLG